MDALTQDEAKAFFAALGEQPLDFHSPLLCLVPTLPVPDGGPPILHGLPPVELPASGGVVVDKCGGVDPVLPLRTVGLDLGNIRRSKAGALGRLVRPSLSIR